MGGLGFHGDNRGFKSDPGATARIWHRITFDLKAAAFTGEACDSNESSNSVIPRVLEVRPGAAAETLLQDELADRGINAPRNPVSTWRDVLPPMRNDYSQARKKPRHKNEGNITAYNETSDQTVKGKLIYAGKNFAFYFADTDAGHWVLGGSVSDGGNNTDGGGWTTWGGVVPDLDVTHDYAIRIDRVGKKAYISSALSGDGFPNAESFLIDSANNVLFLGSHIRIGTAATQLPGGRALPMTRTMLSVDFLEGDLFGGNVQVDIANDYTGDGSPQEVVAPGSYDRGVWNRKHTGREASGDWIRQIEDQVPLPRQSMRWVREQIRKAF